MNTLTYNGYTGSVEFSEEDNVFFGKLEGINALVNYEGESVSELKNAFKEAVTDYLEFCKAESITPEKKF
jgi:predicted HicB family RNase H-like nuclease